MHKQAIKHKQAIIGGGYLFTENACLSTDAPYNSSSTARASKYKRLTTTNSSS